MHTLSINNSGKTEDIPKLGIKIKGSKSSLRNWASLPFSQPIGPNSATFTLTKGTILFTFVLPYATGNRIKDNR